MEKNPRPKKNSQEREEKLKKLEEINNENRLLADLIVLNENINSVNEKKKIEQSYKAQNTKIDDFLSLFDKYSSDESDEYDEESDYEFNKRSTSTPPNVDYENSNLELVYLPGDVKSSAIVQWIISNKKNQIEESKENALQNRIKLLLKENILIEKLFDSVIDNVVKDTKLNKTKTKGLKAKNLLLAGINNLNSTGMLNAIKII